MTKYLSLGKSFLITSIFFAFSTSCNHKSTQELILGKWIMDEQEFGQPVLSFGFTKDKKVTVDRIAGEQSKISDLYTYEFISNNKFFLLHHPSNNGQTNWKMAILDLDEEKLVLLSQGRDSSVRVFKRVVE